MTSFSRALAKALLASLLALTTTLGGCPADTVEVKNLFLEVTSDAPASGKLETLRILLQKGAARYPGVATQPEFNPTLGALDPSVAPVLLSVAYDGTTFGDGRDVVVNVTGWSGGAVVTRFEGQVDLATAVVLKVRLVGIPSGCDEDRDGFFDCTVAGCCAPAGSAFADCGASDATTNPWIVEAACKPCSDTIDRDCSGADAPCVDGDNDQIADCQEEATCGLGDPTSGPGKPEICDGKDNNCKDGADEGLTLSYGGQLLDKGDACGLGACAGGTIECNATGGLRCSNDNKKKAVEDCATNDDDNCNGIVNEGCVAEDFDGDGSLAPADCNDFDAGVYPGRTGEPCCAKSAQGNPAAERACDLNCDGDVAFCETGDGDGDGVTVSEGDCNDNDAQVAPGKPEKCGDGIDQDCAGGDLACTGLIDADLDGWPTATDCDDGDAAVGPDAVETCNGRDDDCDQRVDEGNPGGGAQCGTSDVGDCSFGVEQCQNSVGTLGQVVCVGAVAAKASDVCDGHDEDCDGATDEDFQYQGQVVGEACDGIGGCGTGIVECAPGVTDLATCSTNSNGSESGATTEVCDAIDNDCDGALNEGLTDVADSTCANLGVCAANRVAIVATCTDLGTWDCDYGAVPGYEAGVETTCDALDNDCDGSVNEDLSFREPSGAIRAFGAGCDGDDSDECANGIVACDPNDPTRTTCAETGGPREELCDGVDNDCDGDTDEDFRDTATNRAKLVDALLTADNGAFLGDACGAGACATGSVVCATTLTLKCSTDPRTPASPSAPADSCDGIDNDCDGAVDESFVAGGSVKLQGALLAADNGKAKGASCGAGECAGGTVACASQTTLGCSTDGNGQTTTGGVTTTKTDTCNGKDDNCNGTTDDEFVATTGANRKPLAGAVFATDNGKIKGSACGIGVCLKDPQTGAASPGSVVCNAEGSALICSSDTRASNDVCDNLDNDCDGTDDDPFRTGGTTVLQGARFSSDNGKFKGASCGTGTCAAGKVACAANKTALVCDSETKATTEVCDAGDNDCDGTKDEDFKYLNTAIGAACDGIGGCGAGTVTCAVGVTNLATCSTNPNGPASQVSSETCDGIDNDCNDLTDEGFSYKNAALGAVCTGDGVCGAGTVVCSTTGAATCSSMPDAPGVTAAAEICDALDNNCDGQSDETFAIGTVCDGVGQCGAGVIECEGTTGTTCSTNPNGSAYVLVAEACDGDDDDCDGVNDNGFPDLDADGIADCVDTCLDVDRDGWGRVGKNSGCVSLKTGVLDCNDLASNSDDVDADNVCINAGSACTSGGTTSCSDNCPSTANATQVDLDGDAIGDACDTCVDVDRDGWGRDNFNSGCVSGKANVDDCDDAASNTSDIDFDNSCDTTDTCVDADGDGWGRVSRNSGCLSPKNGVLDCDDTVNNVVDVDHDNLCDNGGEEFCATGESSGCKDNCPLLSNPAQTDIDFDELGDSCDSCVDVDGDGWGRDGFNSGCSGKIDVDDCDDTAANVSDIDRDNTCDSADNCVDVDLDGWGRTGKNSSCSGKVGIDDCNDDSGNTDDADSGGGDNICINDGPACVNGDVTDCSDNCAAVANATQVDLDSDGIGDSCDSCVDVDGDGWGRDNFNSGCGAKLNVDDCDDAAANTSDRDRDNTCDASDTCVDADGDGWGLGTAPQISTCAKAGQDCNDTVGNVFDVDVDNVCSNGGSEFCLTGQTTGCKDNCPTTANNSTGNVQKDTDRDGQGDTCDAACLYGPTPFEICGDCLDNDCDTQVDEVGCVQGRTIVVDTDLEDLTAGYPVALTLDHKNLVEAGFSTASGADLRIYYKDPTLRCADNNALACYREIDRVADPLTAFNTTRTKLWFEAQGMVPAGSLSFDYEIYYDLEGLPAPAASESQVFHMADFFTTTANDAAGWTESEAADNDLEVSGGELVMSYVANGTFQPATTRGFDPIGVGGLWGIYELRIGMDWDRDAEENWNVAMQLGNSAALTTVLGDTNYPNEGVGPSFGWGGGTRLGNLALTTLATEVGGTFTSRGTFDGVNELVVTVDFESGGSPVYGITGTGVSATGVAFTTAQTTLNTLRFFGDNIGPGFAKRAWDYVILRPKVGTGAEPVAYLGLEERIGTTAQCQFGGTNATVRYFLVDGAADSATNIVDDALNNHDLTRTTASSSPAWLDYLGLGNFGLSFSTEGFASRAASAEIVSTGLGLLDFTRVVTFEVVVDNTDNDDDGVRYAVSLDNENNTHVVSLGFVDNDTVIAELRVANDTNGGSTEASTWRWDVPFQVSGRTVLHLVVDTALASNRVQLYYNGVAQTLVSSTGTLTQNRSLHLIDTGDGANSATLTLGNDKDLGSSMAGRLYYAAIYRSALDTTTLARHVQILLRKDD